MKILQQLYYTILAIGDSKFPFWEKIELWWRVIIGISIVSYILEMLGLWFDNNKKFVTYFVLAVIFNMIFGIWKHLKLKTFNWEKFFYKTIVMLVMVVVAYIALYMLVDIADSNFLTDGFKTTIQLTTIFYPIAKIIKSIHIISNGDHPPKWLMDKLYNFEKDGDMQELISNKKEDEL